MRHSAERGVEGGEGVGGGGETLDERTTTRPLYLRDELKEGVGVERADGQCYEVEQQPLVKGFPHEGNDAGAHQGTQRDQSDAQESITPD